MRSPIWQCDVNPTGGDLRFDASVAQVPQTHSVQQFALEQTRVHMEADVIPNRLLAYVDEQVAPGGALNREAYLLYWSATHDWYISRTNVPAFRLAAPRSDCVDSNGDRHQHEHPGSGSGIWMGARPLGLSLIHISEPTRQ